MQKLVRKASAHLDEQGSEQAQEVRVFLNFRYSGALSCPALVSWCSLKLPQIFEGVLFYFFCSQR